MKLCSIRADRGTADRQTKAARELRRGQTARQLQQGQWVPARFSDDPLQHAFVQRSRQDRLQKRARITTTQGLNVERWQADERAAELPCRQHDRDLLGQQAARHECQGPRRRAIEPLRVVGEAQQWLHLGGLG